MPCEVHGDRVGRDQEDPSVLTLKYFINTWFKKNFKLAVSLDSINKHK